MAEGEHGALIGLGGRVCGTGGMDNKKERGWNMEKGWK